jgi:threonine/homoserine/homoserine lactone efflux protein
LGILHDPAQMIAFATFSAVVAGTPGPSNTLLTTIGARVGIRRGLPSLLGQVTGMGAMMFALTRGMGKVLLVHPLALQVLKWGGVAILCWMAWRIATAADPGHAGTAPAGFVAMAAFQWINPKGWLVGVAAVTTFLDPHGAALGQAVTFAIGFVLVALPSCLPWLVFGAALQRFLRTPRTRHVLNGILAALVAASAIVFELVLR